jgi:hypothetical protein
MAKNEEFFFRHNGVEVPAKRLVCWLPEPVHRAIKAEAVSAGCEMGAVVSGIIEEDFARQGVFIDWPDPEPAEKVDAG